MEESLRAALIIAAAGLAGTFGVLTVLYVLIRLLARIRREPR